MSSMHVVLLLINKRNQVCLPKPKLSWSISCCNIQPGNGSDPFKHKTKAQAACTTLGVVAIRDYTAQDPTVPTPVPTHTPRRRRKSSLISVAPTSVAAGLQSCNKTPTDAGHRRKVMCSDMLSIIKLRHGIVTDGILYGKLTSIFSIRCRP